jgi:hypothetical protein
MHPPLCPLPPGIAPSQRSKKMKGLEKYRLKIRKASLKDFSR